MDRRKPVPTLRMSIYVLNQMLAAMLTVSATMAVVKKNDSAPWATTMRRIDLVGDGDIGDLGRHADDEGEIDEVPVVRLAVAGKPQAVWRARRDRIRGRSAERRWCG